MATKSKQKRSAGKPAATAFFTKDSVLFQLTPELKKQMKDCIKRSGSVSLTFKEVSVAKIPGVGTTSVEPISD